MDYPRNNSHPTKPGRKIVSLDTCLKNIGSLPSGSSRVVFTNGCFDILHKGHIHLLYEARKLGDYLVVGLNTDNSIRQIKGPNRPVIPEASRAEVLSAVEYVDSVVFFEEPTPYGLIEQIKPDILVKGADYEGKQIPGEDVVKKYGGKICLISLINNHSTTIFAKALSTPSDGKKEKFKKKTHKDIFIKKEDAEAAWLQTQKIESR
ncbi:MAG: D-glycero-beta-D-manno-heptose 1-phosphate adenylyltransferase [Cytophagales bacterium]|nr:D-glycero-beta-D-manno-heptose 1-phosphate adenylyltransferase [Cytophagales bacterium]